MIRESPLVDRVARALLLGADDHRPQLQQLEVGAVLADARLPVEDRPAVLELDRERAGARSGLESDEPDAGDRDVERAGSPRALRRVPGRGHAAAQVVPERDERRPARRAT